MTRSKKREREQMLRVVVDTNLIVSGAASTSTPPYQLLEAWRYGKYVLVTSPQIIREVKDVLERPEIQKQFSLTREDVAGTVATLATRAYVTSGELEVDVIQGDPDDNKFLACAIEGSATHIVTGDKKHLLPLGNYHGIQIISAREFLDQLKNT